MTSPTYLEQLKEANQIDETGKSAAWIARFGRDAMINKIDAWFRRAAEYDALPQSAKNELLDDSDICSCGKIGCSCDNGN